MSFTAGSNCSRSEIANIIGGPYYFRPDESLEYVNIWIFMSTQQLTLYGEEQNKRKGMTISIIVHSLLLLLALWPLLKTNLDRDKNFAVLIEFEKPKVVIPPPKKNLSGGKASAKSSAGAPKKATPEPAPENKKAEAAKRKVTPVSDIQKPKPRPTTKPIERVITTPDIEKPNYPDPIETPDRIESQSTTSVPTSTPQSPSIEDMLPDLDKIMKEEKSANKGNGTGSDAGDDSNPERGEGHGGKASGNGKGNKDNGGKAAGSGTVDGDLPPGDPGNGMTEGDFETEGPLKRRLKKRADIHDLQLRKGKIVLSLCINRQGQITYARGSLKKSTIKSRRLVRAFTKRFKEQSVFYPDKTAPTKECGTFTYNIEGHEYR